MDGAYAALSLLAKYLEDFEKHPECYYHHETGFKVVDGYYDEDFNFIIL